MLEILMGEGRSGGVWKSVCRACVCVCILKIKNIYTRVRINIYIYTEVRKKLKPL